MMTVGQRIKAFRKKMGFTQSELAERIGVSVQTVSKWECDSGCPDISQIVPLAKVLDTTTDAILGMNVNEEEELNVVYSDIQKMWNAGYDNQSADNTTCDLKLKEYEKLREFVKKYPLNYEAMMKCVFSGANVLSYVHKNKFWELSEEYSKQIYNDVLRMINTILDYDKDIKRQINARSELALVYSFIGEYEKAEEEADKIPDMLKMRTRVKYRIATNKDDREKRLYLAQMNCKHTAADMIWEVFLVGSSYSIMGAKRRKEAIDTWKYLAKITEALSDAIPEWRKYSWLKGAYLLLAKEYLRAGEFEKVIDSAEKLCENNILMFNRLKNEDLGYSYLSGKFTDSEEFDAEKLKEQFKWDLVGCYDEAYDKTGNPVVTSPRFQALVKKIEELK